MTILIVDDSRTSRLSLRSLLKSAGHVDVIDVSSADEAIQLLTPKSSDNFIPRVDLIMMDIVMPEMDGIQACRLLRSNASTRDVPIIMVSGNGEEMYLRDAFAAGATDFINKPAKGVELEARVSSALALKEEIESRKLAYQELEKQLVHSQKLASIGRLVSGVSHDFNNVLTIMLGYSQLGLIDLDHNQRLHGYLQELQGATKHAASLTQQLLDLTRRQQDEPRLIELNSLAKNLMKLLQRLIPEHMKLVTRVTEEPLHTEVDATQIEQVLMNLVINARDAMPDGGQLTVQVSRVELDQPLSSDGMEISPGSFALLSVADTGMGMTDEVKSRIFEPFFTTKGKDGSGTGLGLATCHTIMKENGGCLTVESQPGQGATFLVYLPLANIPGASSQEDWSPQPLAEGVETILLAEDEDPLRRMVATVLEDQGYSVLQACNGEEGLILAKERKGKRIDLLLSDIVMPQLGGLQLARRLKAERPDLKVILTSGYSEEEVNLRELGEEAVFISKPFLPSTLASRVREVLDS